MKIVQIRIVYHTSIFVEDDYAGRWSSMTQEEKVQMMWGSHPGDPDLTKQDPETLFSAGQLDINDPAEVEFVDGLDDFEE